MATITFKDKRMYGQSIGIKSKNLDDLIVCLKQGLPVGALTKLSHQIGVPENKLASTINLAQRTLTRRKKEGRLKTDESERVLRIARIFEKSVEVMGSLELAQQWFRSPAKGLGGKTPLEYSDTEPGAREVEAVLNRIEHGVFF
jgi:putative toxin-antitoxin system antitoxin component (TIGR02293 family)